MAALAVLCTWITCGWLGAGLNMIRTVRAGLLPKGLPAWTIPVIVLGGAVAGPIALYSAICQAEEVQEYMSRIEW